MAVSFDSLGVSNKNSDLKYPDSFPEITTLLPKTATSCKQNRCIFAS